MHIGWDLDDVTTNLTEELLKLYGLRTGRAAGIEDVYGWDFFPPEIHSEMILNGYPRLKIKEGSLSVLRRLKDSGDTVSIITYRNSAKRPETLSWLDENMPGLYDGLYMTGGSKAGVCGKLGVDVLVDDSPRHADEVSRGGIHAVLFSTPMNRGFEASGLIRRAEDYEKVLEIIEILRVELGG
jgi:5'(3')-deoxyribonucleotidase